MRKYKTAASWIKETPGARMYIFMTPAGRTIMYHVSEELPKGKFVLLGIWE